MVPAASARDGGGQAWRAGACNGDRQPCRQSKPCLLPGSLYSVLPVPFSLLCEHNLICCRCLTAWGLLVVSVWQQEVKATLVMVMLEEKTLAPGQFQVWRSQRCWQSTGMWSGGLSLLLSITDTISLFSFPRESTSCWRFCTFSSCLCLKERVESKSKFFFVMSTKKELRGEAVSVLCYHRNRATAKGRAQWFTCVSGQTLETRTAGFLDESPEDREQSPPPLSWKVPPAFSCHGAPWNSSAIPALQCDSCRN